MVDLITVKLEVYFYVELTGFHYGLMDWMGTMKGKKEFSVFKLGQFTGWGVCIEMVQSEVRAYNFWKVWGYSCPLFDILSLRCQEDIQRVILNMSEGWSHLELYIWEL